MKLRWKIFIAHLLQSLLVCFLVGAAVFFITKKGYYSLFLSSYDRTFKLLEKAISTIELDSDKIALNAAYVFRDFESKNGFPNEEKIQEFKNQLSIFNLYAANSQGKIIFSTNGVSVKKHEELKLNLFNGCTDYRKILTHNTIEQTPIIYAKFEPIDRASKYTMISSLDRKRILEVGISVNPIIDRLRDLVKIDENIKSISLFTPTGDMLFTQPSIPLYHEDILKLSRKLVDKSSTKEWIGNDLLMLTKVQPKTNGGKCCECVEKGLTIDGKYYYVLAAIISAQEFETIIASHFSHLVVLLSGIVLLSLLFSSVASKVLTAPFQAFTDYFKKFEKKDVSEFVPIIPSGSREIVGMAKQYNYLIEGAKEAQRFKIESEIQKTLLESNAKFEFQRAENAAAQAKLHAENEAQKVALVRQVKHDLATPIRAAQLQIDHLNADDTDKSELRHIMNQINDIVNTLVATQASRSIRSHMLVSLMDVTVSSLRWAHKDSPGIEIKFFASSDSYSLFAEIEADQFQRALSNVVRNSVQSMIEQKGEVQIELKVNGNFAEIQVCDNGKGIPEHILPRIFEKDFSFDKKNGSGLGLSHAREVVTRWRGDIFAKSEVNKGTIITIQIPKAKPPSWFVPKVIVPNPCTLVIVDDEPFYHEFWVKQTSRLMNELGCNIDLIHHYSPKDFISWNPAEKKNYICIIDHDLSRGTQTTGLDLIEQFQLQRNAYLVTHRWNEESIQTLCIKNNVGLIPKNHIQGVSFKIIENKRIKYDCVIIDDDLSLLKGLSKKAKREGKSIRLFSSISEFIREAPYISEDTDICIDSKLGTEVSGLDSAREFSDKFNKIYSISMDQSLDLSQYPWIHGSRDKDAPWV